MLHPTRMGPLVAGVAIAQTVISAKPACAWRHEDDMPCTTFTHAKALATVAPRRLLLDLLRSGCPTQPFYQLKHQRVCGD